MGERMIGMPVSIIRHVSDVPQPGIVECTFLDAHDHQHVFVEKTAIVSADFLDASTPYPCSGVVACVIVGRHIDGSGREIILIDTDSPWGVESTAGVTQFEVLRNDLVEWEWGSSVTVQWNGLA